MTCSIRHWTARKQLEPHRLSWRYLPQGGEGFHLLILSSLESHYRGAEMLTAGGRYVTCMRGRGDYFC